MKTHKAQKGAPRSMSGRVFSVGPMLSLLLMLRSPQSRRTRPERREWKLPAGCVMGVRYSSR